MKPIAEELASAVEVMAVALGPLTDSDLGQPYQWGAHREGVRFALLGTHQELRTLAVQLAAQRRAAGPPLTRAHDTLAQYNLAFRDLQAVLLGVTDSDYDRSPAAGEWELRYVLGHMVGAERNFYALVDYGWRRQQSTDELPLRLPDAEANRLLGPFEVFQSIMEAGSRQQMQAYHAELRQKSLSRFAAISDTEIDGLSSWWEGEPYTLEYRLHRFDAHLRQHTVQVQKTLDQLGRRPSEALRLLRLVFAALAEIEASLIGDPDLGLDHREALATRIRQLTVDATQAVERATALGRAVVQGNHEQVALILSEDVLMVNATDTAGIPLVRVAVYHGQPAIASLLVESGAALSIHDWAALGRLDDVKSAVAVEGEWLLNDASRDGYTPLHLASFFGHTATATWLMDNGADVTLVSRNPMQIQALHAAAAGGHLSIVAALLIHGADPNAEQQGGFRPLHAAAQNGNDELVQILLAHGADPALTDAQRRTPRTLAMEAGHGELATQL